MTAKTMKAIYIGKGIQIIRQEVIYLSSETRKTTKKAEEKTPQRHVLNVHNFCEQSFGELTEITLLGTYPCLLISIMISAVLTFFLLLTLLEINGKSY